MKIGIPKEVHPGERRVAATPESVKKLQKLGFDVIVEAGAGTAAAFTDDAYIEAGALIEADTAKCWNEADIILKVRAPETNPTLNVDEADLLKEGQILVSFLQPAQNEEMLKKLESKKVSAIAIDAIPRISRSQKMDALSSMANIAGYRAIMEAGHHFGRFFTGQITAAGRIPPAKVMIIGAGVAGLSGIGTANSLGAIVRAFDTRPEVKEQVESMGAEFLELEFEEDGTGEGGYAKTMSKEFIEAEMALFLEQAKEVDIIMTTALIPGRPAPKLITEEMVAAMKEGSVVVDLAAETGGNCELTVPGEVVVKHGVSIIGYTDLPSRLPTQASSLYAQNLVHLLTDMCKGDGFSIDMEDDVIRGATVVHEGAVTFPPPPLKVAAIAKPAVAVEQPKKEVVDEGPKKLNIPVLAITGALLLGVGSVAPAAFLSHLIVFILACFIGFQVVWNVSPSLHTPLMSVTNAISGIIVIGAMLQISGSLGEPITILAAVAVLIASINIGGGFAVTQRMLRMFRK
ncbi:MAG: NAD(P)(+) transhydrogenase (Re/Si-specific) subunit alpha [Moraxellaceae bacterium]|nr:MAG: NAD(P)(+) transhydrogenase (Re/Si-specific) subunit alpha [Moraxellaceae bacterium]